MSALDSARIRTAEGQKLAAEQIVGFRESSDCPITNAFLYDIGSKLREVCQGDLRTDDTYRLIVEIIRCIDCGLSRYTHSDYSGSLHFENFANCFLSNPLPFFPRQVNPTFRYQQSFSITRTTLLTAASRRSSKFSLRAEMVCSISACRPTTSLP